MTTKLGSRDSLAEPLGANSSRHVGIVFSSDPYRGSFAFVESTVKLSLPTFTSLATHSTSIATAGPEPEFTNLPKNGFPSDEHSLRQREYLIEFSQRKLD